jgi:uncharacterized protein YycO
MYLLFSDSPGIGPWVIRLFTRSKWSHVDVVLGQNLSDPETPIIGATTKGVIRYKLGERLNHARRAIAVKITPNGVVKDQVESARVAALRWLDQQVGKDYDWGAIFFAIGLNRNWRSEEDWFCSELAAAFALQCGMPVVDPDVNYRVTPQDIYNSPFSKIAVK